MKRSVTHNFEYTREDIQNLIKRDVAEKLNMETIPIIAYDIDFQIKSISEDGDPNFVFDGATLKLEIPG